MKNGAGQEDEQTYRRRLVKSARMYAMCKKAGVRDAELNASLGLAAFEDLPLAEASAFIRSNRVNLEDMAWALKNSGTSAEFETRLRERLASKKRRVGE